MVFIKEELNWSYCATTIAARKLHLTLKCKKKIMAKKFSYNSVKFHNIPQELIVKSDNIEINMVLRSGTNMWSTN